MIKEFSNNAIGKQAKLSVFIEKLLNESGLKSKKMNIKSYSTYYQYIINDNIALLFFF